MKIIHSSKQKQRFKLIAVVQEHNYRRRQDISLFYERIIIIDSSK